MTRSSDKKKLLNHIKQLLKELGYSGIKTDATGYLRVPGRFGSAEYETVIRAIDEFTAEFRTAYHYVPEGNSDAALEWLENIFTRMWGTAALALIEEPDGKLIVVVSGQLRLVDNQEENKGLLFYMMYSIREYFQCWEYDADFAEYLQLRFPDIDASSPI